VDQHDVPSNGKLAELGNNNDNSDNNIVTATKLQTTSGSNGISQVHAARISVSNSTAA